MLDIQVLVQAFLVGRAVSVSNLKAWSRSRHISLACLYSRRIRPSLWLSLVFPCVTLAYPRANARIVYTW